MELWENLNLKGFFELAAWGPDYMRAYQALSTWSINNTFMVTNF